MTRAKIVPLHQWRTVEEKEKWGPGPWLEEPDKVQWIDRRSGLDCLIVRNRLGAWCGYVGVPEGHPYHGLGYDGVEVEVHGGLTFAGACQVGAEDHGICHIPEPGRPDNVWWLGFDCAHFMDLVPGMVATAERHGLPRGSLTEGYYRDQRYVQREVTKLAQQLAKAA